MCICKIECIQNSVEFCNIIKIMQGILRKLNIKMIIVINNHFNAHRIINYIKGKCTFLDKISKN